MQRLTDKRRKTARFAGLALILSTPVTLFMTFAFFATVFGEQQVEGTWLGTVSFLLPAALGAAVIVWAQLRLPLPSANVVASLVGLVGAVALAAGIYGILITAGSGDPNIGSPILTVLGLVTLVIAGCIVLVDRNARKRAAAMPPPPSGPPAG